MLSGLYKNDNSTTKLFKQSVAKRISAYKKAMQLDPDELKLSAAAYATMKHGLPEELKIKAIQKELKLGGNGTNDSHYWYLHSSNISALQQAGRLKEAKQALKNMQQELEKENLSQSQYQTIVSRAQEEIDKQSKRQKIDQNQAKTKEQKNNRLGNNIILWSVVIFSVLALLAVTFYEFFLKKKK